MIEVFRQDLEVRHKEWIIIFNKLIIPAVELCRSGKKELWHHTVKVLPPSGDLPITNWYSPPPRPWPLLVVGDFKSHSPSWGYEEMDLQVEEVGDWMMEYNLVPINQSDDKPTWYSRAWKISSTPDLSIATEYSQRLSTIPINTQLEESDHMPVILNISSVGFIGHSMKPSWTWN